MVCDFIEVFCKVVYCMFFWNKLWDVSVFFEFVCLLLGVFVLWCFWILWVGMKLSVYLVVWFFFFVFLGLFFYEYFLVVFLICLFVEKFLLCINLFVYIYFLGYVGLDVEVMYFFRRRVFVFFWVNG